jgi:FMN phosphatase YigB (HAD superfamily)
MILAAEVMVVDIDGTLTSEKNTGYRMENRVFQNSILGIIRDLLAQTHGLSFDEATAKMQAHYNDVIWWDYPEYLSDFDLPLEEGWRLIEEWTREDSEVHEDGVRMIKYFAERNKKLVVISNNPVVGCMLKLQAAGLAERLYSPYFERILGANILRGQKSQLSLWKRAAAYIGVPPENVVIIGDNILEDGEVPLAAGFGNAIIVQREGKKAETKKKNIILVESLDEIKSLIK